MKQKTFFLFVILIPLHIWCSRIPEPIAMRNLGTTCYMNAALQCLYQVKPLTHFVLTEGESYYKLNTIAFEYTQLIKKITQKIFEPEPFCKPIFEELFPATKQEIGEIQEKLKKIIDAQEKLSGKKLTRDEIQIESEKLFFQKRRSSQQDASEFLVPLLDHLSQRDMKEDKRGDNKFLTTTGTMYKTPVSRLFTIIFGNRITSTDKNFMGAGRLTTEPAQMVSLSIVKLGDYLTLAQPAFEKYTKEHPDVLFTTLNKCLDVYFASEHLEQYKYNIAGEQQIIAADKKIGFIETPPYVIIHLQRLLPDRKLNHGVTFPVVNLDLKPYFDQSMQNQQTLETLYNLASVIVHIGDAHGGHYIAYVKHNNQWYKCDDDEITTLTNDQISMLATKGIIENPEEEKLEESLFKVKRARTPYILFYKRQDQEAIEQVEEKEFAFNQDLTALFTLINRLRALSK